jgi:hypothetical protein
LYKACLKEEIKTSTCIVDVLKNKYYNSLESEMMTRGRANMQENIPSCPIDIKV